MNVRMEVCLDNNLIYKSAHRQRHSFRVSLRYIKAAFPSSLCHSMPYVTWTSQRLPIRHCHEVNSSCTREKIDCPLDFIHFLNYAILVSRNFVHLLWALISSLVRISGLSAYHHKGCLISISYARVIGWSRGNCEDKLNDIQCGVCLIIWKVFNADGLLTTVVQVK